jgi:thiosulfate/3-mercaptopyruvate sulfurtransferase
MKIKYVLSGCLVFITLMGFMNIVKKTGRGQEPWKAGQLMAPSDLAAVLNNANAKKPIVYSVGPGALIKGSLDMGPAHEKENLDKLKAALSKLPKNADIIIYCGCCPFDRCPNIRPAFSLLNEMQFTNARLLNLEHNIRTDWVAKGYPSVQ